VARRLAGVGVVGARRVRALAAAAAPLMTPSKLFSLAKQSVSSWSDDFAPSMGAAISYYTVFSLSPLLLIIIAVAGLIFGEDAVQGQLVGQLQGFMGREGATAIQTMIKAAHAPTGGIVATGVGVVLLLVGATTVFAELQSALDRIWKVPAKDKPKGLWPILRARVLSFGLILTLAFMLMVTLALSSVLSAVGKFASGWLPGSEWILQLANIGVSISLSTVLFAMIFKYMPSVKIEWRDVWTGAFVTALLFEVGKYLIGLYIGKSGTTETFAAAGSIVVLLIWVYYAAQIFLLGAEFTKVYANDRGSRVGRQAVAASELQKQVADEGLDAVAKPHSGSR
ncbi:MAG: YihY/virulence factor BrkB family protein, partial [Burkholderiaceae bacterium]